MSLKYTQIIDWYNIIDIIDCYDTFMIKDYPDGEVEGSQAHLSWAHQNHNNLQNNYHWKSVKRSPTTKDIKKEPQRDW